jgi:hypothetical protein
MRVYYALVSNTQVPDELEEHADEIIAPSRLEIALTRAEEVIEPYIEIAAGLLIVFVCIYAYVTV